MGETSAVEGGWPRSRARQQEAPQRLGDSLTQEDICSGWTGLADAPLSKRRTATCVCLVSLQAIMSCSWRAGSLGARFASSSSWRSRRSPPTACEIKPREVPVLWPCGEADKGESSGSGNGSEARKR